MVLESERFPHSPCRSRVQMKRGSVSRSLDREDGTAVSSCRVRVDCISRKKCFMFLMFLLVVCPREHGEFCYSSPDGGIRKG